MLKKKVGTFVHNGHPVELCMKTLRKMFLTSFSSWLEHAAVHAATRDALLSITQSVGNTPATAQQYYIYRHGTESAMQLLAGWRHWLVHITHDTPARLHAHDEADVEGGQEAAGAEEAVVGQCDQYESVQGFVVADGEGEAGQIQDSEDEWESDDDSDEEEGADVGLEWEGEVDD